jgi:hypothetical protein
MPSPKFYICDPGAHHKNVEAIRNMLTNAGVEYVCCNDLRQLNDSFTVAMCFTHFFPPHMFPAHCKVIYGPQFFVFPNDRNHPIHHHSYDPTRFFYNTLSDWNLSVFKSVAPNLTLMAAAIPMGININAIQEVPPLENRKKLMIYFKHRHPSHLNTVTQFLTSKQVDFSVISYGSYKDPDFKRQLQDTRFIIWIGSHESQGFAFQETQASNIPILVWDVTSMRDEFAGRWGYGAPSGRADDLAATTANCWSDECGFKFFQASELPDAYDRMNERLSTFTPRKYIEDKLSLSATYQNLLLTVGL